MNRDFDIFKIRSKFIDNDSIEAVLRTSSRLILDQIEFNYINFYLSFKNADYSLVKIDNSKKNQLPSLEKIKRAALSELDESSYFKIIKQGTPLFKQIYPSYKGSTGCVKNITLMPLFGQKRLIGVVSLINLEAQTIRQKQYDYLSYLSAQTSHYCSYQMRKEILEGIKLITTSSLDSIKQRMERTSFLKNVLSRITNNSIINYSAIAIRLYDHELDVELCETGGNVNWTEFIESSTDNKYVLAKKVAQHGKRIVIPDIQLPESEQIINKEWAKTNNLHGYCCQPISFGDAGVGSITVFTSYEYDFYDLDFYFLETIANCLSITICALETFDDFTGKHSKVESTAVMQIDSVVSLKDFAHRYKNDLINCKTMIKVITERASGAVLRDASAIQAYLTTRQTELEKYLLASVGSHGIREYISLNDVCRDVVKSFLAESRTFRIKFDASNLSPEVPDLKLNRARVFAVILNLVQNSIKSIVENKSTSRHVRLSTYLDVVETKSGRTKGVTIEINDTGSGIDNDIVEDVIFEEGYSGFKERSTGKGLYDAMRVVNDHYGQLYAVSSTNSTTFYIKIPLRPFKD